MKPSHRSGRPLLVLTLVLLTGLTIAHDALPHLHVRVALPASTPQPAPFSLDLYQSWDQPFDGSDSRLSLSPSLTYQLHSPSSSAQRRLEAAGNQLQALSDAESSRTGALEQHQLHLRAAYLNEQLRLLETWLELTADVTTGDPAFGNTWQSVAQNADAQWLQLELLAMRGFPPGPPRRPLLLAEPDLDGLMQLCLLNSLELQHLEVMNDFHRLSEELADARRQLHAVLSTSINTDFGPAGSSFGASLSLTLANRSGSGNSASLSLSPRGLNQSAAFSWPPLPEMPGSQQPGQTDGAMAVAIGLHELVASWLLSEAAELRSRDFSTVLLATLESDTPDPQQLEELLGSMLERLSTMQYRDSLTLELASLCRLPYGYLPEGPLW